MEDGNRTIFNQKEQIVTTSDAIDLIREELVSTFFIFLIVKIAKTNFLDPTRTPAEKA